VTAELQLGRRLWGAMKLLDLLTERFLEKRAKKYGKGCARAMLISALAMKEHYKGVVPSYAWLARKALNTRPNWKQVSETVFIYEPGPNSDGCLDPDTYSGQPWLGGTLDITDDKSLWDVIQDVIRTELYWNYLSDLEIWKRFELTDLALSEAAKLIKGNQNA
jgi:hypothetical protein